MNKAELDRIHNDFLLVYPESQNGRNKEIRKKAQKKVENAIDLAERYISQNQEAYILLTGGDNNTDFGRAIIYDEFTRSHYFGRDMYEFLDNIKEKIASFEE
jgi:hypothetical protein